MRALRSLLLGLAHRAIRRGPFRGRGLLIRAARALAPDEALAVTLWPGFRFPLDLRNPLDLQVFSGEYEPEVVSLLARLLGPGDVFVDAGANIGLFTALAAARVAPGGAVLAYEPGAQAHARAAAALALGDRPQGAATLVKAALLEKRGEAFLQTRGIQGLESSIGPVGERVRAESLDERLAALTWTCLLAKLDVEGTELRLLRGAGALLGARDAIVVCELNDPMLRANGGSVPELVRTMEANGFRALDLQGRALDWRPSMLPWTNCAFVKGDEASRRFRGAVSAG